MSSYRYSIVIPHRNQPALLRELLLCIPQRRDIQIIVSDDGSSSKHKEALDTIRNEFHLLWEDKPEEVEPCVGYARNRGIDKATGDYILFADSDDLLTEGLFDELDLVIMNNPEAEIIYIGAERGTLRQNEEFSALPMEKRKRLMEQALIKQQKGLYEQMYAFLSRLDTPWAKLINMEKAGDRIYFPHRPVSEDVIQNMKLLDPHPEVAFLLKPGYIKRELSESLSSILNKEFLTHRFEASLAFHQWIRKKKWKEGYTMGGGFILKAFQLKSIGLVWLYFKDCVLNLFPLFYPLHRYAIVLYLWIRKKKSKEERQFYLITGQWEE